MFGVCNLSIVPIRKEYNDKSEMVSQLLYGDCFEIIDSTEEWLFIKTLIDKYKGWIDKKQYLKIKSKETIDSINNNCSFSLNILHYIDTINETLLPIVIGSNVNLAKHLSNNFDGDFCNEITSKENLLKTANIYLRAPYLWGGKTPFGIDCSGLTQMVYRINGYNIPRDAKDQSKHGTGLSFIDESEPGDQAFFDNSEGEITHVGLLLKNNHIIHAYGNVRIDKIDQTGIYNLESKRHTHSLRIIKKII